MVKDVSWKEYLSVDERYADLINGISYRGRQVIGKADLDRSTKMERHRHISERCASGI